MNIDGEKLAERDWIFRVITDITTGKKDVWVTEFYTKSNMLLRRKKGKKKPWTLCLNKTEEMARKQGLHAETKVYYRLLYVESVCEDNVVGIEYQNYRDCSDYKGSQSLKAKFFLKSGRVQLGCNCHYLMDFRYSDMNGEKIYLERALKDGSVYLSISESTATWSREQKLPIVISGAFMQYSKYQEIKSLMFLLAQERRVLYNKIAKEKLVDTFKYSRWGRDEEKCSIQNLSLALASILYGIRKNDHEVPPLVKAIPACRDAESMEDLSKIIIDNFLSNVAEALVQTRHFLAHNSDRFLEGQLISLWVNLYSRNGDPTQILNALRGLVPKIIEFEGSKATKTIHVNGRKKLFHPPSGKDPVYIWTYEYPIKLVP